MMAVTAFRRCSGSADRKVCSGLHLIFMAFPPLLHPMRQRVGFMCKDMKDPPVLQDRRAGGLGCVWHQQQPPQMLLSSAQSVWNQLLQHMDETLLSLLWCIFIIADESMLCNAKMLEILG